ncbi:hypothetical protein DXT89_00160 [Agrobacterium vitis]|uniref:Uncharacterized protein n=1 Tax=Agrobacterium vitis TaxID=373 RepID=A0A368NYW5_AGRVI|nr:hypothetical protein DXM22_03575 [Agrobacterium vitis]KAA3531846.1 hypothetical protein DXT89_00160 [Agrobacterium vitis]RCU54974.1 hypothetical protein ASB66_008305 [Agrobacterium vitis]
MVSRRSDGTAFAADPAGRQDFDHLRHSAEMLCCLNVVPCCGLGHIKFDLQSLVEVNRHAALGCDNIITIIDDASTLAASALGRRN